MKAEQELDPRIEAVARVLHEQEGDSPAWDDPDMSGLVKSLRRHTALKAIQAYESSIPRKDLIKELFWNLYLIVSLITLAIVILWK